MDAQPHCHPGRPDVLQQAIEIGQPRLGSELGLLVVTPHRLVEATHLRKRSPTGLLDVSRACRFSASDIL